VLFNKAIDASPQGTNQEERMTNLINVITKMIYTNVSRGLFERDKAIFSFLIATSIDKNNGSIDLISWGLLLRGSMTISEAAKKKQIPNPMPLNILDDLSFEFLYSAQVNSPDFYGGLTEALSENNKEWLAWATCESPQTAMFPGEWQTKLSEFQRLVLLKAFRPEKIGVSF
jgi:dynein heavy chain